MFGNRLSKYAIPNPPESRKSNTQTSALENSLLYTIPKYNMNESSEISNTNDNSVIVFPEEAKDYQAETEIESQITEANIPEEYLQSSSSFTFTTADKNTSEQSQEAIGKAENFEIRKGSTNDMIIKGRFVQTNDYLVVSYTPPKKWSLQQQIEMLDVQCKQQLRKIRQLNKENHLLKSELKKHEKLLPKLRYLQNQNNFLYAQLKMYKLKEKEQRKRRKEKKLKGVLVKQEMENKEA